MTHYEYKVEKGAGIMPDALEAILNQHARDGWRLMTISGHVDLIFEREVKDESGAEGNDGTVRPVNGGLDSSGDYG